MARTILRPGIPGRLRNPYYAEPLTAAGSANSTPQQLAAQLQLQQAQQQISSGLAPTLSIQGGAVNQQVKTPNGTVNLTFPNGVPTIAKNAVFTLPYSTSSNGFTQSGTQTYDYTLANNTLNPNLISQQGSITYNGTLVGSIGSNGQLAASGNTVQLPVNQTVAGIGSNVLLGTVTLTPSVSNNQLQLVPTGFSANTLYAHETVGGVGYSLPVTPSFNASTGTISIAAPNFAQAFSVAQPLFSTPRTTGAYLGGALIPVNYNLLVSPSGQSVSFTSFAGGSPTLGISAPSGNTNYFGISKGIIYNTGSLTFTPAPAPPILVGSNIYATLGVRGDIIAPSYAVQPSSVSYSGGLSVITGSSTSTSPVSSTTLGAGILPVFAVNRNVFAANPNYTVYEGSGTPIENILSARSYGSDPLTALVTNTRTYFDQFYNSYQNNVENPLNFGAQIPGALQPTISATEGIPILGAGISFTAGVVSTGAQVLNPVNYPSILTLIFNPAGTATGFIGSATSGFAKNPAFEAGSLFGYGVAPIVASDAITSVFSRTPKAVESENPSVTIEYDPTITSTKAGIILKGFGIDQDILENPAQYAGEGPKFSFVDYQPAFKSQGTAVAIKAFESNVKGVKFISVTRYSYSGATALDGTTAIEKLFGNSQIFQISKNGIKLVGSQKVSSPQFLNTVATSEGVETILLSSNLVGRSSQFSNYIQVSEVNLGEGGFAKAVAGTEPQNFVGEFRYAKGITQESTIYKFERGPAGSALALKASDVINLKPSIAKPQLETTTTAIQFIKTSNLRTTSDILNPKSNPAPAGRLVNLPTEPRVPTGEIKITLPMQEALGEIYGVPKSQIETITPFKIGPGILNVGAAGNGEFDFSQLSELGNKITIRNGEPENTAGLPGPGAARFNFRGGMVTETVEQAPIRLPGPSTSGVVAIPHLPEASDIFGVRTGPAVSLYPFAVLGQPQGTSRINSILTGSAQKVTSISGLATSRAQTSSLLSLKATSQKTPLSNLLKNIVGQSSRTFPTVKTINTQTNKQTQKNTQQSTVKSILNTITAPTLDIPVIDEGIPFEVPSEKRYPQRKRGILKATGKSPIFSYSPDRSSQLTGFRGSRRKSKFYQKVGLGRPIL